MTAIVDISWEERKQFYTPDYYDGELEGHYREWWWTDFSVWGPRARVVYEAFRPETVLVCGCAKGSLVKFLNGIYSVDAYGFDLSNYAINTTPYPEIQHRLSIVDLATETLNHAFQSMDVVTCYDFLEHNDDEHIESVCSEVMRIARQYILIRMPLTVLSEEIPKSLLERTKGLPFLERMRLLRQETSFSEWMPDAANIEHPNARSRNAVVELFSSQFKQIYLDSYFYDIMMGSSVESQTPVIPFFDTIVLERSLCWQK